MNTPEPLFATIRIPLNSVLPPQEFSSAMARAKEEEVSFDELTVRALRHYVATHPVPPAAVTTCRLEMATCS